MARKSTVVLVGGAELTGEANVRALEDAGFMVIKANTLDYALVANELFEPKALVLDADQTAGNLVFFCRTLTARPRPPAIYILGGDKEGAIYAPLLTAPGKYLQKPLSAAELAAHIIQGV